VPSAEGVTVQIPGPMNPAKFLLVLVLWLFIVLPFAGVVITLHKQWTPPQDILDLKDHENREDQCEALNYRSGTRAGTVLEPQNTWSNVFYLLAGMTILFCTSRPLGYLVGAMLCVLALLSGMYHGTLQPDWQLRDVASIYFILWSLNFYAVNAVVFRGSLFASADPLARTLGEWGVAIGLGLFVIASGNFMAAHRGDVYLFGSTTSTFTFVAALIVACTCQMARLGFQWSKVLPIWRLWAEPDSSPGEYLMLWRMFWRDTRDKDWHLQSYFWAFVVVGGTAMFCRLNDGDGKLLCSPDSPIQAHAIWHTFGALVLLLGYDFLAWSSQDYPVFVRSAPATSTRDAVPVAALASIVVGCLLLGATFVPKLFIDGPHSGDSPGSQYPTGIAIGGVFIVFGVLLYILRAAGVIGKPQAQKPGA